MKPRRFIVMGTDTGVGKTHVGVGLCVAWRALGHAVVALKPVESGVSTLLPEEEDGARLARATGQESPRRALYRLGAPIAPPAAADQEGADLSLSTILEGLRAAEGAAEVTLIEGAGGVLSPLTWDHTALDIAREMDASVILVAADTLGALNQVRSALRILWASDLEVLAVVLSDTPEGQQPPCSNQAGLLKVPERIHAHVLPRTVGEAESAAALHALAQELVA
jgi:dethiobiotin synthetase